MLIKSPLPPELADALNYLKFLQRDKKRKTYAASGKTELQTNKRGDSICSPPQRRLQLMTSSRPSMATWELRHVSVVFWIESAEQSANVTSRRDPPTWLPPPLQLGWCTSKLDYCYNNSSVTAIASNVSFMTIIAVLLLLF